MRKNKVQMAPVNSARIINAKHGARPSSTYVLPRALLLNVVVRPLTAPSSPVTLRAFIEWPTGLEVMRESSKIFPVFAIRCR